AQWAWRQDNELARGLSPEALQAFQRADQIKRLYFRGGSEPSLQLYVKPSFLNLPGAVAKFEIAGASVNNPTPPPPGPTGTPQLLPSSVSPVPVQWPGAPLSRILLTLGTGPTTEFFRYQGYWSMFRAFEAGGLSIQGESASVHYPLATQNGA